MKKALAFDIGGTKIYSTVIDETGKIVSEIDKFSTPKTLDEIKSLLKTQIAKFENDVDLIAIATAGAVNNENTRVLGSTGNLVPPAHSLRRRHTRQPVKLIGKITPAFKAARFSNPPYGLVSGGYHQARIVNARFFDIRNGRHSKPAAELTPKICLAHAGFQRQQRHTQRRVAEAAVDALAGSAHAGWDRLPRAACTLVINDGQQLIEVLLLF